MSVTNREILAQFLEKVRGDILEEHIRRDQRVTGKTLEGFEISANEYSGTLIGAGYIEYGRRPGKMPPVSAIEQWIRDRGITPKGKISILGLAFIMARKISTMGTIIHQQGGKSGVISNQITQGRIDSLIDSLSEKYRADVTSEVVNVFK